MASNKNAAQKNIKAIDCHIVNLPLVFVKLTFQSEARGQLKGQNN